MRWPACLMQQRVNESVTQACPTLWDTMDCSPPGSCIHGDSPGKDAGVGCHSLLQGIFPTQESNPGLLFYRQILYHLSFQGSSRARTQSSPVGGKPYLPWTSPQPTEHPSLEHCEHWLLSHSLHLFSARH